VICQKVSESCRKQVTPVHSGAFEYSMFNLQHHDHPETMPNLPVMYAFHMDI